jgi:adhesin/invasin
MHIEKNFFLKVILTLFVTLSLIPVSLADVSPIKNNIKNSFNNKINSKINAATAAASEKISTFAKENFENIKYLDFSIQGQEELKPTFSIMSVNEILKINSGTIFNQSSFNNHDGDQTINIGFGTRKLISDNKVLLGSNIFYDHQFNNSHKRAGAGVEAVSSVFDVRGNYYNALSGRKNDKEGGIERALDGWDTQVDYHLPIKHDVSIFLNAFEFENPGNGSDYKETGNKMGLNARLGHFLIEAGYMDDNQENDSYFGSIKFVIDLGQEKIQNSKNFLEYEYVGHKLYEPVKRENKIRLVKISAAGVVAGGF